MTQVPPLPFLRRGTRRRRASRGARPSPPTAWSSTSAQPIEVIAPDRYSTALLLEYASPLFQAEIVAAETSWVVRLHPPAGGGWVLEVLSLVERWLESTPLPCASLIYGGRRYLIRASTSAGQSAAATGPEPGVATALTR